MATHYTDQVLAHLQNGRSISSIEAIELFGDTRLSATIYCLKKRGYEIECERVEFTNRNGIKSWYGRYHLVGKHA